MNDANMTGMGNKDDESNTNDIILLIPFRGKKFEIPLFKETTPFDVKSHLASNSGGDVEITPNEINLIHKGKVIKDMNDPGQLFAFLSKSLKKKPSSSSKKTMIRLMATGVSATEAKSIEESKANAPRVRDDLTDAGRREIQSRQRLGRKMMADAARKGNASRAAVGENKYGFAHIETLPMLPEQSRAKEILQSLANDPGILACMAKHQWNVGCLAEMYPEGKVGESAVCVMGLNQNKGQKILLRLRTDDLRGFRKLLSIRKVLFHELAHNVHSEHDGDFFRLMRQIEKECNEMDWTGGAGLSDMDACGNDALYQGGTYRLGGGVYINDNKNKNNNSEISSVRELAARAALMRMNKEEEEIQNACGCGRMEDYQGHPVDKEAIRSESKTTYDQINEQDTEDDSR